MELYDKHFWCMEVNPDEQYISLARMFEFDGSITIYIQKQLFILIYNSCAINQLLSVNQLYYMS